MIVFIKDKRSFISKATVTAVDYELHQSIYDTVSRVTIPTPSIPVQSGDFIILDGLGYVGIITEVVTDKGRTDLSVTQAVNLFGRDMFYSAISYTYLEDYIKSLIDANYTNCSDDVYELPYLEVNALTHTNANCKPDLDSDNVYNIKSYLSKVRRLQDVFAEWDYDRNTLTLNLRKKTPPIYNIDLSNPRYVLTEQTFSEQTVGKITAYCEENGQYSNWYLKTDGSVVSSQPASDRVDGEWQTLTVREAEDIESDVRDVFAKNYYSHKILFKTNADFNLYDRLRIRMDGKIFNSYVSGTIKNKGSKIQTIECGELQIVYPFLKRL